MNICFVYIMVYNCIVKFHTCHFCQTMCGVLTSDVLNHLTQHSCFLSCGNISVNSCPNAHQEVVMLLTVNGLYLNQSIHKHCLSFWLENEYFLILCVSEIRNVGNRKYNDKSCASDSIFFDNTFTIFTLNLRSVNM